LFWIAIVAGLAWSAYFVLTNPRFYVHRVTIDGVRTLNPAHIEAAAQVPARVNIFRFWLEKRGVFCARIQACDPVIESESVAIDLPNVLRVRIVERQPFAVLNLPEATSYILDSNRVPYRTIALNQAQSPIVTIPVTTERIVEGHQLPSDIDSHVKAGYYLLELLTDRHIGPLSDIEDLTVDKNNNINLRLHSQLLIKLGQTDGLPDRLAAVETALAADPSLASKAQYLDFTTSRPAIMEKAPPPAAMPDKSTDTANTAVTPLSSDIGH
jgi:hypothetical protein